MGAGIGFVPNEVPKARPARSSPAGTRVARSFADGSQLRSLGKEACNPTLWEDLKSVRLFSYHRSREMGRGSMTYAPQRAARAQELRERAGGTQFARHEADPCVIRTLCRRSTQLNTKCHRVCRRPAIWRCHTDRRARRKANELLCAGCSLGHARPSPTRVPIIAAAELSPRGCHVARG